MSTPVAVLLAVVLLLGNAFFVGAEFAMISARRSQIEPLAEAGSRAARAVLEAMEQITLVIGVNQLGITVCSLMLGAVGEPAVGHLIEPVLHLARVPHGVADPIAFVVSLLLVVFLHVVMGEMIPKNIALAGPDRAALVLAPPVWALARVLRPVIRVINAMAALVLRGFGVEMQTEVGSTYTREEVAALVEESRGEGLLEDDEYDRLAGALGFTEKSIDAVVLPTAGLATVTRGSSAEAVEALCATTGFSRFPVADAGDLVGYLHIKDVLEPDEDRRSRPIDDKWVRPFATVPLGSPLHEALEILRRRGAHMARVVDAEGTPVGVATLEDVIEELVGEIHDAAHLDETS